MTTAGRHPRFEAVASFPRSLSLVGLGTEVDHLNAVAYFELQVFEAAQRDRLRVQEVSKHPTRHTLNFHGKP
ncbi:MAG: hypothetical protein K0U98_23440 [Deltaproteobacteria bacterium]|nr:hypothetical protein [Deltaproteobacteria bacterium]